MRATVTSASPSLEKPNGNSLSEQLQLQQQQQQQLQQQYPVHKASSRFGVKRKIKPSIQVRLSSTQAQAENPILHSPVSGNLSPLERFNRLTNVKSKASSPPILQNGTTAAFESISDGVIVFGAHEFKILYGNTASKNHLNFPNSFSLTGIGLETIFPDLRESWVRRLFRSGTVASSTTTMKIALASGHTFNVDVSLGRLPSDAFSNSTPINDEYIVCTFRRTSPKNTLSFQSRYKAEFEELNVLGRGGFGVVVRARNRLDGQEYAIKKVKLSCLPEEVTPFDITSADSNPIRKLSDSDAKILREVKTFARISHHKNVCRYYHAWIERSEDQYSVDDFEQGSDDQSFDNSDGDAKGSSYSDLEDDEISNSNIKTKRFTRTKSRDHHPNSHASILFIQMQLCPFNDLRKWLDARGNHIDRDINLNIFKVCTFLLLVYITVLSYYSLSI